MPLSHQRYAAILGVCFLMHWIFMAIHPNDRQDWALENVLVILCLLILVLTASRFPLSRISYTLLFIFLLVHEIGAHYTYAEVPYDQWCQSIFGISIQSFMGWERNHFDRLIHFSYGLLLAYPIREVFHRVANVRGFWGYFLPLDVTMSTSMLFELFEWAAAEVFGGDLGIAYLGTQGDVWDAHKDMGLASLGAIIAMLVTATINIYLQRDFAREWADSLSIKGQHPLGEDAIQNMRRMRKKDDA